jgi:hypothetical protein
VDRSTVDDGERGLVFMALVDDIRRQVERSRSACGPEVSDPQA